MQKHVHETLSILSKRWTLHLIFVLLNGPLTFRELAKQMEGIGDPMLSERLKALVSEGLVAREVTITSPIRVSYSLTPEGYALRPVVEAIEAWSVQRHQETARSSSAP